jgi:putative MATE family efflux protein
MKKLTRDMTSGSPMGHILAFALPMMLGIIFQQFYSMVDTMVVGKWIGVEAIAGVGSTGSVNFMIIGFCNGLGTGLAIPVARAFGAKDYSAMRRYVTNALWISIALCAVVTAVVSVFCMDILKLMQTPSDIIGHAYNYIFIIFLGIPILYAYNLLASILRALGDSKSPVYFLIVAAIVNIVLDVISVVVLKMGVEGPALATLISQLISAILCFVYMIKKFDVLKIQKDEWRPEKRRIGVLLSMGIPMGLQYSITAIGTVVIQMAVNGIGTAAVAAVAAANRIAGLVVCPYDALGSTMATFAGQNAGVGDCKRIKKGVLSAMGV